MPVRLCVRLQHLSVQLNFYLDVVRCSKYKTLFVSARANMQVPDNVL